MLTLYSCWMRSGPFSIGQMHHTNTHVDTSTCTQYNPCYLFFFFSLSSFSVSVWCKHARTYLSTHANTNTKRTLWPNSTLIDVCLSVKEAQHKEQQWACMCELRANKERSIPRQLSDSSGNTAFACLSYSHILSPPTVCSAMNNNMAASVSVNASQIDLCFGFFMHNVLFRNKI